MLLNNACQKNDDIILDKPLLDSIINTSRVLTDQKFGIDYEIKGCLEITGPNTTVTIEPNNIIMCHPQACIKITNGARLIILGEPQKETYIAGFDTLPGYWQGIWVEDNSTLEMQQVIISDAGKAGLDSNLQGSIFVDNTDTVIIKIKNSIIRNSAAHGIVLPGFAKAQLEATNKYLDLGPGSEAIKYY
ncbi:MAG: hypothetical protein IPN25_14650 [Sphingobacteriales bacterium]|nr:hypothetical protein [Sphingobacteriales bacterium]MBK8679828.1 hypothetical protein [Sphingobacteriales bacterium]MBL0246076.1 hypothetical protein [Sphingobacteriales bacterium]